MVQVVIDISTQGDVTVKAQGAPGKSCQDLTKQIESALGKTKKDIKTSEYYQQQSQQQRQQ